MHSIWVWHASKSFRDSYVNMHVKLALRIALADCAKDNGASCLVLKSPQTGVIWDIYVKGGGAYVCEFAVGLYKVH